jgi:hypothetical protein
MAHLPTDNQAVRDLVAGADRRRRARLADARVQRLAPWAAGLALAAGLTGRLMTDFLWIGLAALGAGVVAVAVYASLERRARPTTDSIAAAVDADAALGGELRSAHWFEAQGERDRWADFHVDRATARARGVDWPALYPRVWSAKPWLVAGAFAAGVVAFTVRAPAPRVSTEVSGSSAGDLGVALPPDLQEKLARLMAQLNDAALNPDAKAASLAELKELLAKLTPEVQKQLAAALEQRALGAEPKAAPQGGDKNDAAAAAQKASGDLPEDVKWALENLAAKAAQADDRKPASTDPAAPTKPGDAGPGTLQSQAETGAKADSQAPIMREAAADDAGKKMIGGGGPMGGDSQPGAGKTNSNVKGAAEAVLLAQALRKEMLEASADALGNNVDKEDLRRKTEQGTSSLGFTRVAVPRTSDPSRAAAPPPVPEERRSLLYKYFIRR